MRCLPWREVSGLVRTYSPRASPKASESLLQVELLSKPLGVARQETKLAQVADVHDIYAILTIRKLDYGPAQQSNLAVSSIMIL
ncbi:MAG: hypothetical protein FRX49_01027 [Trebouxia sp. A1-2]|nr:MAG: hypothetical protein FRX49_01027 [Trebouxia sp. A1-2]